MIERLDQTYQAYPRQFWLMFVGMFISTVGASMIWPFLMLYVSKQLSAPLTITASLLTLNAGTGLVASFLGGPLIDRIGRKWIMAASLASNGLMYVFLGHAVTFPQFALLLGFGGAVNPLYRSAADAMVADLVPSERRIDAYSLMRWSNNLGIAIGPLIGGSLAASSYTLAFYAAACGMILYSLLLALFAHETLPSRPAGAEAPVTHNRFAGYPVILRDRAFVSFWVTFTMVSVCAVLMWTIMPVYANRTFGVSENLYKWIPATNAIMVVTLQTLTTSVTKRYAPLLVLSVGSFFYAIAVGGVAFAQGFLGFWIAMVIMTIGELILVPTSSTYVANLAPIDMRGRYMSLFGLSWPIGAGIGPLIGGILSDLLGARATWYGGLVIGMLSAAAFLLLSRLAHETTQAQTMLPTAESSANSALDEYPFAQ
jgi:MFS family permease